eukprot:gnl/TRDRNA2_/TRDRNA2_78923_c1_seq2.p2 gnl/TRDRNA2_/TRDRNA2_78923_c1~~gnl/TRDRNA2_/TRDRNA2_78923_c1_seq2.p2  ORF type:complete len:119 (+),score=20.21 gnl/TRDRNA2_/TRDRNA2_78923_c1_seq2:118-474(+)
MNLMERVLNVCANKWIDEVIIGAPPEVTPDLVSTWSIKVVARGAGYRRSDQGVFREGNRDMTDLYVEVPSKWPDLCQETLVKRIMASRDAFVQRNRTRAKREDDYYKNKDASALPQEA